MELLPAAAPVLVVIALAILVAVSYHDFKRMEIPDVLSVALALVGLLAWLLLPDAAGPLTGLFFRLLGVLAAAGPLLLVALIVRDAIGGGDIKLMAAAGFLLGWQLAFLALVAGLVFGAVQALLLLVGKRLGPKEHFPFAPALCSGIALALLGGPQLLRLLWG